MPIKFASLFHIFSFLNVQTVQFLYLQMTNYIRVQIYIWTNVTLQVDKGRINFTFSGGDFLLYLVYLQQKLLMLNVQLCHINKLIHTNHIIMLCPDIYSSTRENYFSYILATLKQFPSKPTSLAQIFGDPYQFCRQLINFVFFLFLGETQPLSPIQLILCNVN